MSDAANEAKEIQRVAVPIAATTSAGRVDLGKAKEKDGTHPRVASRTAQQLGMQYPRKRVHFVRIEGSFATGIRFIKEGGMRCEVNGGYQGE